MLNIYYIKRYKKENHKLQKSFFDASYRENIERRIHFQCFFIITFSMLRVFVSTNSHISYYIYISCIFPGGFVRFSLFVVRKKRIGPYFYLVKNK